MNNQEKDQLFELLENVIHARGAFCQLLNWRPLRLLARLLPRHKRHCLDCVDGSLSRAQLILWRLGVAFAPEEEIECRPENKPDLEYEQ